MTQMPPLFRRCRAARFGIIIGLALLQAGCLVITAFSVRTIFGDLHLDAGNNASDAALWAIVLAGLGIAVARIAERSLAEGLGQDYAADVRASLFESLSDRRVSDLSAKRNGSLSLRFVGDLTAIKGWISQGLTRLVSALIVLVSATAVIALMNEDLAGAVIVPVAIACGMIGIAATRLARPERRLRSRRARLAADMSERVPHAPELRLMGRMGRELSLMERRTRRLKKAAVTRAGLRASLKSVADLASGIITAWVLWIALSRDLSAADAAGMLAAAGLMVIPLRDLATVADRRYAWVVARSKCERVFSHACSGLPEQQTSRNTPRGKIKIRNFRTDRVAGFSSTLERGDLVVLQGKSGSGKSYLMRCLAGLERPLGGYLSIGRTPKGIERASRALCPIAFIGPETPILAGTLRRALTMGLAKLPDDDAIASTARRYGLGSLLDRIEGLDHRVAENGRDLSSGERAAVLLTRAVLNRPALLVYDEIDSGLGSNWPSMVHALQTDTSACVIASTRHDPQNHLVKRRWQLDSGRLEEDGCPQHLPPPKHSCTR